MPALIDSEGANSPRLASVRDQNAGIKSKYFAPGDIDSFLENIAHTKSFSDYEFDPIFTVIKFCS